NEPAQDGDERGHARGLFSVVIDFAGHVDIQARIGGERVLQLLEGRRRSEVHGHRLGDSVRTVIGAVEKVGIAPNFGIEGAATRVERAYHFPTYCTEGDCASQSQTRISGPGIFADDEFGDPRLKHSAFNDLDIAADGHDGRRNATKLDV